jgi:hypothetical protein
VPENTNSNFIALIPKVDHPKGFGDFVPIALCNMTCKENAKIIALRISTLLSNVISDEQFKFLQRRHIHEVIGSK